MMVCRSYLLESLYRINITSDSLGPTSILSLYLGPPSILESQIDRMPVIELATNPLSQFLYALISKGEFQLKVSFFVFLIQLTDPMLSGLLSNSYHSTDLHYWYFCYFIAKNSAASKNEESSLASSSLKTPKISKSAGLSFSYQVKSK